MGAVGCSPVAATSMLLNKPMRSELTGEGEAGAGAAAPKSNKSPSVLLVACTGAGPGLAPLGLDTRATGTGGLSRGTWTMVARANG